MNDKNGLHCKAVDESSTNLGADGELRGPARPDRR